MKSQKPSPPDWLTRSLSWLSMVAPCSVDDSYYGWCCDEHQKEHDEELDVFNIKVIWLPHHKPIEKWAKAFYDRLKKAAKASRSHELVHFSGSPSGFVLSLKKIDSTPPEKGALNVDI